MFKALDYVNYNTLQLNHKQDPRLPSPEAPSLKNPTSLQERCCDVLNETADLPNSATRPGDRDYVVEAVQTLPPHMAPLMFRVAINQLQFSAISRIISVWPLQTFCLRDLLPTNQDMDIFQEELGFDLLVFRGLLRRKKTCKMSVLDLRGFKLNKSFSMLIVQLWPLISLPKRTMTDIKRLTQIIIQNAGLDSTGFVANHFREMLQQKVASLMNRCKDFHINIEKGQQLLVKLDSLLFSPTDALSHDYLIAHCLRDITPLKIQVSHFYFRTSIYHQQIEDIFLLSPYTVLKGHDTRFVEGVSLRQLEEGVFKMVAPLLYKFKNLQAIELQDCNIYLQNGRTRSKTEDRKALCTFLSSFPLLVRLDMSFSYLVGCLGEVLEAVQNPLQYLGLRGCDLDPSDLEALARSKHADSLRELNISKISFSSQYQYYIGEPSSASTEVVTALKSFPHLNILNLSQLSLPDAQIDQLCHVLRNHLRELKVLDLSAMVMTPQHQLQVCLACGSVASFQKLSITLVTSLVEELNQWNGAQDMVHTITTKLRELGRWDIRLETVLFSRAIFLDIVDDLQF